MTPTVVVAETALPLASTTLRCEVKLVPSSPAATCARSRANSAVATPRAGTANTCGALRHQPASACAIRITPQDRKCNRDTLGIGGGRLPRERRRVGVGVPAAELAHRAGRSNSDASG